SSVAGMIGVELDTLGRLIRLEAAPAATAMSAVADRPPDWEALLAEAGLDRAAFAPAEPIFLPPFYATSRMAWAEVRPARADPPLRVEAAAEGGRPVYFELTGPWSKPPLVPLSEPSSSSVTAEIFLASIFTVLLVGGCLLAR